MKISFFILGKKGFVVLNDYISNFGPDSISHVIAGRDNGVDDDFFEQIKKTCRVNNIDFFSRGEVVNKDEVDYSFAIGWKWILKNLSNLIVFHDSILPKYRGFAPLVNMLINGESRLGVTALIATENYDEGDVISQEALDITYPLKISEAIDLVIPLYCKLVLDITNNLLSNLTLLKKPQNNSEASYSLWRDEADYKINWNRNAKEIKRFIDAVGHPFKGAMTHFANNIIRISSAEVLNDVYVENRHECIGKVIFKQNEKPIVICAEGLLRLDHIRTDDGQNIAIPFRTRFE